MKIINRLKTLFLGKTIDTKVQLFRSSQSSQYSYFVDLGFYVLMVNVLSVPYLIARLISYTIGMTCSYFISVLWIFPSRNVSNRFAEYGGFAVIGLIGAVENIALMALFSEVFGLYHLYANILAGIIVFFFNFFVRKILLFRDSNKE